MTEEQLNELCIEWQKVLRLQDWDIVVKLDRQRQFENKTAQGEVAWVFGRKEAIIKILDPTDYPTECIFEQDQEETLVHELLHLHFADWSEMMEDGNTPSVGEQGIQCIAQALVRVKRQSQT